MMNLEKTLDVVCAAAGRNIPFAAFALPSEDNFRLFLNPSYPEGSGERFVICPWLGKFRDTLGIYNEVSPEEFATISVSFPECSVDPEKEATKRDEYIRRVSGLIEILKNRGNKTVISRIITGSADNIDLKKFISLRFRRYPGTFRFVYYTPETGLWTGTSPEELLTYDSARGRFSITALAGTRQDSDLSSWDLKNIVEQSIVGRFIGETLDKKGIKYISKVCSDVVFHPVRHLCHRYFGHISKNMVPELLDMLSPTPALCGYPRDESIKEIAMTEDFSRRCYGGYIGLDDRQNLCLYVNLRCINISKSGYCIYAGGGITGDSVAEKEWEETESKAETMIADLRESIRSKGDQD